MCIILYVFLKFSSHNYILFGSRTVPIAQEEIDKAAALAAEELAERGKSKINLILIGHNYIYFFLIFYQYCSLKLVIPNTLCSRNTIRFPCWLCSRRFSQGYCYYHNNDTSIYRYKKTWNSSSTYIQCMVYKQILPGIRSSVGQLDIFYNWYPSIYSLFCVNSNIYDY